MKSEYYRLHILHCSRPRPQDYEKEMCWGETSERFKTLDDLKGFLKDMYGKVPKPKHEGQMVYMDVEGKTIECGFINQFWIKDYSHGSKSWWQVDYICIEKVKEEVEFILNL